jgi:hypothetical protein
MDEFNPYAAPKADIAVGPHGSEETGCWSDGKLLVMSKNAMLPDRCVKCNEPAGGYKLKRNLMWHSPWYYLVVLLNLIIYVIVAMIVRYTAKVYIPLCRRHKSRRRWSIAAAWLSVLLGIGIMIGGAGSQEYSSYFISVGVVVFVAGVVLGVAGSQTVVAAKIDKHFVWLKKVHPSFLADLPSWYA